MGQWLGKLYSTEEMLQTPTISHEGHQHRILNLDPRSPSYAIPRTPIEVESTPKRAGDAEFATPRTTMQATKTIESLHQRILKKQ
uniref:Uncharacterized protein n=1 Tax=Parascaris univalens TaxID=6257 RepID=A0A915C392_PARUN